VVFISNSHKRAPIKSKVGVFPEVFSMEDSRSESMEIGSVPEVE